MSKIFVDNFAGGGGASTGIEMAIGRSVDIAINHDPDAIAMHTANHPTTKHYLEDVWQVDPVEACAGRKVALAWFSPDCTHFSRAKGNVPVKKNIRGLAWVAVKWALLVRPDVLMLENVPEIRTWGPIADGKPIKDRAGETFDGFICILSCGLAKNHPAFVECCEFLDDFYLHYYEPMSKCAREAGISIRQLIKYLRKQRRDNDIWHIYNDYLKFAEGLKYDMSVHNVRYPKNLLQAHNRASAAYTKIEKQIEMEKYARELRDRELRYNFALCNYTIFIPEDPQDIVKEGKALSHCVGGYLDRHCEGKLTILFMRHIPDWNVPLYTIEMNDGNMRQVQGYKNLTENKPKGEAKAVLDTYLKWVEAGSPRNKDGRPKLNAKCRMQSAELRTTSA